MPWVNKTVLKALLRDRERLLNIILRMNKDPKGQQAVEGEALIEAATANEIKVRGDGGGTGARRDRTPPPDMEFLDETMEIGGIDGHGGVGRG